MTRDRRDKLPKKMPFNASTGNGIAVCDGCGFVVHHQELREQKDYRGGDVPVGLGYRLCKTCYSEPNQQLRKPKTGVDPVPLQNPRPFTAPVYGTTTAEQLTAQYKQGG